MKRGFGNVAGRIARAIALTAGLVGPAPFAAAQTESGSGLDARRSRDFFVFAGTLLPSRNGLLESVPGWGLRVSQPSAKGVFEIGFFSGIGNGIVYRSAMLDYRMDLLVESVSAHFLLGFHGDQFSSQTASSRFAGGWHYGGGITMDVAGPILLRFDFRHRFSPGQEVEVMLGIVWRLSLEGGGSVP